MPMYLFLTGPKVNLVNTGVQTQYVKLGGNAFPDLAPGLALPYTLPQYKTTPQQAVELILEELRRRGILEGS